MSDGYCMQPPLRPRVEIPWADLLLVLEAYDIRLHVRAPHGGAYVRPGFAGHYRLWFIGDNGGELNVEMVNHDETYRAVPYQDKDGAVDAGTLAYRVAMCIKGEPVDWGLRCPELVAEMREMSAPSDTVSTNCVTEPRDIYTSIEDMSGGNE